MSRVGDLIRVAGYRFPRVSGDEPYRLAFKAATSMFSPRERG